MYITSMHILPIFLHQLLLCPYRKVILKRKLKPLAEEIKDLSFLLPSLKSYPTPSQSLGLFWLRASDLLSFLLEVKIDMSIVIIRQISERTTQPVDVAHLSPDTQSLTWLI